MEDLIAIAWVHFLDDIECNSKPHIPIISQTSCARSLEPSKWIKRAFPQPVIILMVSYITIGNIHAPKVYANLCQNVCITHVIMLMNNFVIGNVFKLRCKTGNVF